MYKFQPILKSLLWGGDKLLSYKEIQSEQTQIGESWELSAVPGSESVVAEGPDAGRTLTELVERDGAALLGRANHARFGREFPLLIKFIDARSDLSIQVHPDDALARERHGSKGKTEMWYVVGADEGARLLCGFAEQMNPESYAAAVADHTLTDHLKSYAIRPGDLFFLPAGRVHAIGAGSLIAEIQQTSDITYRIYDYDRRDAQGRLRELHTELAKDAIDYTLLADYRTPCAPRDNEAVEVVRCRYFTTSLARLTVPTAFDWSSVDSFQVVMCTEGRGTLTDDAGRTCRIHQGETVLIPAATRALQVDPAERMTLLLSCIDC